MIFRPEVLLGSVMASRREFENFLRTLFKVAAENIAQNFDSFHNFLVKTWESFNEVYESLRKMREKFEGEYTECCNKLIAIVEEARQYLDEVRNSLVPPQTRLNEIDQQIKSDPPNYSAIRELVGELNKCINQIEKFQREFSKQCDDAIAGANETATKCEGLAARARTTQRAIRAVGFGASMAGAVLLGAVTAGIGTAVGVAVGAATGIGGGYVTHTWANDYEEAEKELIELKKKLKALRQTNYELQAIVRAAQRIVKKIEPLTDTIDRLSTSDGEIHNREGLQIAFQSLVEELKRTQEHTSSSQENLKATVRELKHEVAIESEGYTARQKFKQS